MAPAAVRILLLERTPLQGDVLRTALESQRDLRVVERVGSADAAARRAGHADVVLIAGFPGHDGVVEVLRGIVERAPGARIVVSDVPRSPAIALEYLEAGASGYVYQGESVAALVERIRDAAREGVRLDPTVARALLERVWALSRLCADNDIDVARLSALTPREMEVLERIERGETNKQIARALGVEAGTVKNHVHSLLGKLGVSSRAEAALFLRLFRRNGT